MRKVLSFGSILLLICLTVPLASVNADVVVRFNTESDADGTNMEEPLGAELDTVDDPADDNSTSTATLAGITFVTSATSNFGDMTAVPNPGGGGFGVNTGGGGNAIGDAAAAIDDGETLTIAITFDESLFSKVSLAEIDFGGVTDNTDSATVSVAGNANITVFDDIDTTGLPFTFLSFDILTFTDLDGNPVPIDLSSGDTLVFSNVSTGDASFEIDSFDLHLTPTAIPEPSSLGLLGLLGLGVATRRRR